MATSKGTVTGSNGKTVSYTVSGNAGATALNLRHATERANGGAATTSSAGGVQGAGNMRPGGGGPTTPAPAAKYQPGTYGVDAKGNRVSANSASATSYGNLRTGSTAVASSDYARTQTDQATSYLDTQRNAAEERKRLRAEKKAAEDQAKANAGTDAPVDTSSSDASAAADALGGSPEYQRRLDAVAQQKAADAAHQKQMSAITRQWDTLAENADAATSNLIENIKANYENLVDEQRAANKAFEAGTSVNGLVSGRAQYAPEMQAGILHAVVSAGIQKIQVIQAQRAQHISEAEVARSDMQYKILTQKMSQIRQTYVDERDAARQINEDLNNAYKFSKEDEQDRAKQYAPLLASSIVGDLNDPSNQATIAEAARGEGISPGAMYAAIDEYRRATEQSLPEIIRELNMAKAEGWVPQSTTPNQYRGMQAAATRAPERRPAAKTLSVQDAVNIGFPELEGVPLDEITLGSTDEDGALLDLAPAWVRDSLEKRYKQSISEEEAQRYWDAKKRTDPFKELVFTGNVSAGVSVLTGRAYGLPPGQSTPAPAAPGTADAPVEGFSGSIPGLN